MKRRITVIPIALVIGMLVWTFFTGDYSVSWIMCLAGTLAISVIAALGSEKKEWKGWYGTVVIAEILGMFFWVFVGASYEYPWLTCMIGVLVITVFGILEREG